MIVDLVLHIDGLILEDESVDDYVKKIEEISNTSYPIIVDVDYVEGF